MVFKKWIEILLNILLLIIAILGSGCMFLYTVTLYKIYFILMILSSVLFFTIIVLLSKYGR